MNRNTLDIELIDITGFLAVSRQYLAPEQTTPGCAESPIQQQAATLKTTSTHPRKTMSNYRHLAHKMLLAAGLGVFLAGPVFAETGCTEMGGRGFHHERRAKDMEQHHQQLHDALKLTPAQEPGWTKLMDSEKARPAADAMPPEDWSKLTTPERAEKMLARSKAHQEHMSEHVAALKAFYATLTPEQQKIFEDSHAAPRDGKRGKPGPRTPGADKAPAKP